jgi:hypothetical protein
MKWQNIKLSETAIKRSMRKALHERLGPDATLGDVSRIPYDELKAIPGAGGLSLRTVKEALLRGIQGLPQRDVETVLDVVQRDIETVQDASQDPEEAAYQGDIRPRGY